MSWTGPLTYRPRPATNHLETTYSIPILTAARGFCFIITRSPAQKSTCKDLGRNGQIPIITSEAAYVLVYAHNALPGAEVCV
ncbi:hypothetical protein DA801_13840 [Lacticaseibacillus rhamnosus]|uniref:Alpha-galactosidase n=1 Tax=Lacticaseibacillus rhamnosus TaxID=47715 RepID=A0AAP8LWC3_LACRH|nr:hypothetical protein CYJ91_06780 [Lacticaseibacillus rhamnosus]PTM22209.1 hypothetical protein DA801_13840 [Lacticaseibacillus rhamnosus]TXK06741.1 hypothetical protein FU656_04610 [Lacticaseibacillus rhamnosus]